ncbi:MAG: septum formation initiator family protein [Planctomycetota bacterium]
MMHDDDLAAATSDPAARDHDGPHAHTHMRPAAPDLFGIATFWSVVATLALATLLLYCLPAASRIERQAESLKTAQEELAGVRDRHEALEAEAKALDDPFYIEKILRFEYNWRPRSAVPATNGNTSSTSRNRRSGR